VVSAVSQFDAYENPSVAKRDAFPYVVVMHSDRLAELSTRFVMPLARLAASRQGLPRRLGQTVEVDG
jgi:hypothetical protein